MILEEEPSHSQLHHISEGLQLAHPFMNELNMMDESGLIIEQGI